MPPVYENFGWGLRPDGAHKGPGFAAGLTDLGEVITEMSAGPNDALYPLVYQGITPWEVLMLQDAPYIPYSQWSSDLRAINDWALYQASLRNMAGKPPFWQSFDGDAGAPYTYHRSR